MAEAVLSALLQVIFENLSSQSFEEYGMLRGTNKEMRKLQSVLSTIQAVLEDAEDRQVLDKAVKDWLIKLKDIAYDADDLLDEYISEASQHKLDFHDHVDIQGCMIKEVRYFCSQSNLILCSYRVKRELKNIVERLNTVADERFKFHLKDKFLDYSTQSSGRLQSDSFLFESEVFGRDEEKEKIMKFLMHSTDKGDVSVLPLVGMGGLGKTTLAKLVYNDKRVEEHFEQRIWVCVSEEFDVKRLMRAIVESVTGNRCDLLEMETIHRHIQELIMGKRFLLVLDDVWNDDHEKRAFKCGKPEEGSSILAIGKEIAKNCRGVPLAAKALGSLMSLKRRRSEWLLVKDNEIWNLIEEENGILPVLRLSYDNLPSHLKQCFAYCSLFPKGCRIKKEKLIHLWMAEGFIGSSQRKPLEEVGNEYFNELFWRSFFQNATKDSNGDMVDCEMHDLLHDLARSVAGTSCLMLEVGRQVIIPTGTRHLSIICNETENLKGISDSKLRSFLLLFARRKIAKVSGNLILSIKSLRTLDISSTGIKKLSKSIGALKHLRFLDLSYTLIKKLPNSICSLFNLQTLVLLHCSRLEILPENLRKLVNLRHLNRYGCGLLTELPNGIGELGSLKTLPLFIVGKQTGCGISQLQGLDLHGELKIKNLENVRNERCARDANPKEKRHIQSLELLWENVDEVSARENVECVTEGLQPNFELKKLLIENYVGSKFPSWLMNSSLTNLVELSMVKCQRCAQLPPLGKLPALEVLRIDGIDATMYFSNDSSGASRVADFVSLKRLSLKDMPNLLGWSSVEGRDLLPCLKELIVEFCPKLTNLPYLPSIESLELNDCSNEILATVTKMSSLSNALFSGFLELIYLPQGLLRNKKHLLSLEIRDCPKLRSFSGELDSLSALQSFRISNCPELESLSELGSLKSLKSLFIDRCHNLGSFAEEGMGSLTSLQHFSLSNCENITAFPHAMKHLVCLQTLHIWSCPKLSTLPESLGNLAALKELELWYCENLLCLPESMQRLTSLQFLSVWSCPHLEIQCEKDQGKDWHKIKHIPFIKINGPYIQAIDSQHLYSFSNLLSSKT
ncbi:putative disease resistance protein RGA3 [Corylus avellana]|uniref:putative disease resistance protein RGA3 n=1 Tax=Corylus avellana TaxID=13451 RepID=UPI00286CC74A|nr:putative disease resistance protein RGA3 [Corylus avellana]